MNKTKITEAAVSVILAVSCAAVCIMHYSEVVDQTCRSVERCLFSVIPSLYAPMFTACLITGSGLHNIIGKIFSPLSRYVFRLPPEIFAVFLISNVSGYPSGIKLLDGLRKNGKITDEQFRDYSVFCFSAGPAFVAGTVSSAVSASVNIGLIIYISTFTANIIIALIKGAGRPVPERSLSKTEISGKILVDSAAAASSGMLSMCTMITVFAVIKVIAVNIGIINAASSLTGNIFGTGHVSSESVVLSFLEITSISGIKIYSREIIPLMSAIFSFGGICVISQISYISDGKINILKFAAYRVLTSLLSYFISLALCRIFIKDICISASTFELHSSDHSLIPSVILLIMSVMLTSFHSSADKNKYFLSERYHD